MTSLGPAVPDAALGARPDAQLAETRRPRAMVALDALGAMAELTKLPITAMATLTTATGFLLFARRLAPELGLAATGTFLIAAAASALNQLQEARFDARMARTTRRPLPSGRIGRPTALLVVVLLAGLGLAALASLPTGPMAALGLGALAMVWYNAIYTPLKRVSAFAAVPGAVIGAIPPLIGWVAAGGSLSDGAIWFVAALMFLWQVPHFWLLVLLHGDEYASAGLPSLTVRLSRPAVARMTFAWLAATAAAAPLAGIGAHAGPTAVLLLCAAALWLVVSGRRLLGDPLRAKDCRRIFRRINLFGLGLALTLGLSPWLQRTGG